MRNHGRRRGALGLAGLLVTLALAAGCTAGGADELPS